MKAQQLAFIACVFGSAQAYVVPSASSSSFLGQSAAVGSQRAAFGVASTRMDTERDVDLKAIESLERILREQRFETIDRTEAKHGMPWKSSINKATEGELLYMPFWEWHMDFMKDNLTNLRVMPCSNAKGTDFSFNENKEKKARIVNMCFESSEYRKIRLTYYDAGDNTQVYNAVFYPDPKYNLPVLGIDLLAFNRKKYLTIVDFQPLHQDEADHAAKYEHLLKPIKEGYDSLKGRMSSKFYDETKFFSQQMLFARFEEEQVVTRDLFPAFQEYVKTHLKLIQDTEADHDNAQVVLDRQREYDTYSAERDPATGLFAAMYGNEWAQDFVHDFLFSMSERKEGAAIPAMPSMGGPPRPSGGGNPYAQQQPKPQQEAAARVR